MNIDEEKARIRKEIKRRRNEISSQKIEEIDSILPEFISAIDDDELQSALKGAKRVALYRAVRGEVPVDGLAEALMARGIKCCFPRVEGGEMVFCDCTDLSDELFCVSSYGIKEPVASLKPVKPEDIDVVVMPAVAYNEEGTRLGMGGGFYDRYFGADNANKTYLLGICYEFQICSDVPNGDKDIVADFIAVIPEEVYEE